MEIKKGGFIATVAYCFDSDYHVPKQTNLCSLWWRFVFRLVPFVAIWTVLLVFLALLSVVGFLVGNKIDFGARSGQPFFVPIRGWPRFHGARITPANLLALPFTLLVSMRPAWLESDGNQSIAKVEKWPTLFGSRVWPIIIPLAYVIWMMVTFLVTTGVALSHAYATQNQYVWYIISAFALALLMTWAVIALRRTSFWHMTKEFLRAKKEKVCPIVYIR